MNTCKRCDRLDKNSNKDLDQAIQPDSAVKGDAVFLKTVSHFQFRGRSIQLLRKL